MNNVTACFLGQQDYVACWRAMRAFTDRRDAETPDEIWSLQHAPVFTQGQNGKPEHILDAGTIPVVKTDRGGQVTYHGLGQLVVYPLINLTRKKLNIRAMVSVLENTMIQLLAEYNVQASAKPDAPGVYVAHKKIGSVGLRVRRGCSYHGLALNIKMDLAPFSRINPCGFKQLEMTQLADFHPMLDLADVEKKLMHYLIKNLDYDDTVIHQRLDHAIEQS